MENPFTTIQYRIQTVDRSLLDAEWCHPQIRDPFNRLYLILAGEGWMRYNTAELHLRPGYLYHLPLGGEIHHKGARKMQVLWTHYHATLSLGLDCFSFFTCPFELKSEDPGAEEALFSRLQQNHGLGSPVEGVVVHGVMNLLLAPFFALVTPRNDRRYLERSARFEPLLRYIEDHLNAPLRNPELAALLHLETTYFSELFKDHFGLPPARYIRLRRVEAAARLLLGSTSTLERIATHCGFSDACHLTKVFKEEMGMPPGAFRSRGVMP